jgi:hypothetical protein
VLQLDDVELIQGYFQQDSATCHMSNMTMELIESFFPDQFFSLGFTEGQGVCKQTTYVTGFKGQHFS